jgi:chaperonin GroES
MITFLAKDYFPSSVHEVFLLVFISTQRCIPITGPGGSISCVRKGEGAMKIRPLQDRILVKRVEEEGKTSGGIIIPDTAKEKPMEGKVVAVGKGKVLEDGKVMPLDVNKGDRILFSKYAGTEVKIEGQEHLIIREEDVLGVIEK